MTPSRESSARRPVPGAATDQFTIRPLTSHSDLLECVAIQREVWGADFQEITPPALLKVMQKIGGVVAGAFDGDGTLAGVVIGMTGVVDGRLMHWSHMLAVRTAVRGAGIGRKLKEYQREVLADMGVDVMRWSFDPLVSRNAHLNLDVLGAHVVEYVPDMYPPTSSKLHGSIPIDRLIVEWEIAAAGAPVRYGTAAAPDGDAAVLDWTSGDGEGPNALRRRLAQHSGVRILIPRDFQAMLVASPPDALALRRRTREFFQAAEQAGHRVVGFDTGGASPSYVLARDGS